MRARAEKQEEKQVYLTEEEASAILSDPGQLPQKQPPTSLPSEPKKRTVYTSVSLPMKIMRDVDRLIDEFGYWPSRSAFVREACVDKIRDEQRKLGELKEALRAKEEAVRRCEPALDTLAGARRRPVWKDDQTLLAWLTSL